MESTIKPIVFNAKWHKNIFKFRKKRRVLNFFIQLAFFPITITFRFLRTLVRKQILPSSTYSKKEIKTISEIFHHYWFTPNHNDNPIKEFYHPTPLQLITPDGASLSGIYFKHIQSDETTPTIILFQPNASLTKHEEYSWLLEKTAQKSIPSNFVTFDYRGCGESLGKTKNKGTLLLDGDTVYQFVKDELMVPSNLIYFYGYSLGGAISASIRALYPEKEIKYVNERSFSSLSNVIKRKFPKAGCFLSWLAKNLGWDLQVLELWPSLCGEKLVIFQPEDEIIPYSASLFHGLFSQNRAHECETIHLELSSKDIKINFHHSAPLNHYVDKETKCCAQQKVLDFLFKDQVLIKDKN